jgi:hypothetical protein
MKKLLKNGSWKAITRDFVGVMGVVVIAFVLTHTAFASYLYTHTGKSSLCTTFKSGPNIGKCDPEDAHCCDYCATHAVTKNCDWHRCKNAVGTAGVHACDCKQWFFNW